jgi:hypothetical protein
MLLALGYGFSNQSFPAATASTMDRRRDLSSRKQVQRAENQQVQKTNLRVGLPPLSLPSLCSFPLFFSSLP